MKTNSFDRAMQQITNDFQSQQLEEDRKARRRQLLGRIRKGVSIFVVLALFGAVFALRADIQKFVSTKLTAKPAATENGAVASSIGKAQENANARDAVIDGAMK